VAGRRCSRPPRPLLLPFLAHSLTCGRGNLMVMRRFAECVRRAINVSHSRRAAGMQPRPPRMPYTHRLCPVYPCCSCAHLDHSFGLAAQETLMILQTRFAHTLDALGPTILLRPTQPSTVRTVAQQQERSPTPRHRRSLLAALSCGVATLPLLSHRTYQATGSTALERCPPYAPPKPTCR